MDKYWSIFANLIYTVRGIHLQNEIDETAAVRLVTEEIRLSPKVKSNIKMSKMKTNESKHETPENTNDIETLSSANDYWCLSHYRSAETNVTSTPNTIKFMNLERLKNWYSDTIKLSPEINKIVNHRESLNSNVLGLDNDMELNDLVLSMINHNKIPSITKH